MCLIHFKTSPLILLISTLASSPKIPNGFAIKTPEPEDVIPNMSSRFSPSWVYNIPFLDIEFDLQYHGMFIIIISPHLIYEQYIRSIATLVRC